jgi:DNA-binding PadR family transcriptional regulator
MTDLPSETEQLVLLALARLGESAYGVTVRAEIQGKGGRAISIAAVYNALDRLEHRGCARSWYSEPVAERGGRARKHFSLTAAGAQALRESRHVMDRMWDGVRLAPGRR